MNDGQLKKENDYIASRIESGEPASIIRFGTETSEIIMDWHQQYVFFHPNTLHQLWNNAGIYCTCKKNEMVCDPCARLYGAFSFKAIETADALACFTHPNYDTQQEYFLERQPKLRKLHNRSLEPFYVLPEKPWTHALAGKRVLIVHPFTTSMQRQYAASQRSGGMNAHLFGGQPFWPSGVEFVWFPTYNTVAGNIAHRNWFETCQVMCRRLAKERFDVALLGCGGYGLPLIHFIRNHLKRSCIYVGGALQLFFGIKGSRWEMHQEISQWINENWVRPRPDETPENARAVENGCYW